jgi:hypothetical protein
MGRARRLRLLPLGGRIPSAIVAGGGDGGGGSSRIGEEVVDGCGLEALLRRADVAQGVAAQVEIEK